MKCPYCGKDMIKGVIQSSSALKWSMKKYVFASEELHSDVIHICKGSRFTGFSAAAYNCISCNKIIIDYGCLEDE